MDWNNDGKKDLVTGERDGYVRIYLNVGTDASPTFNGYSYLRVAGTNWQCLSSVPEVVDWNNDGLKDVLCGEDSGRIYLLINSGTASSPLFSSLSFITNGSTPLSVGSVPSPTVVDWNRDGKKDIVLGNVNGYLYFFQNKGTDVAPVFNGYELFLAGGSSLDVGYYSQPAVTDWDNDGRWDILCGAYEQTDDAHVWYFHAPTGPYLTTYSASGASFEPGTSFNLVCTLKNPLGAVTNVSASLASASPWCEILQPAWTVGDMPTNSTRVNSATPFVLRIKTNALLGVTVPLNLAIEANGGTYRNTNQIRFEVAKPIFSLVDYFINDSQGNGNCALESGEKGQLVLRLRNSGYRAENVTGRITYGYGFTLTHPNSSFGTLERNATNANAALPFGLTALSYVPALPNFFIDVTCDRAAFTNQLYVDVLPEYSRSNGASFAWVDTTGGTNLTLANDGCSFISLPPDFYFQFYQYGLSYFYLSANGFLSMSSSSVANNTVIPGTASPNGFIAPFWDDLDPAAGGTVRYKFFGTSYPNRYMVVEWNNVPRRGDAGTRVTIQAIVYENGDIKFQYGPSSGVNADGRSATIGIEDYSGTKGTQYAFNQVGAVSNGLALYFRCSAASGDTDGDGLPDAFERFYFGGLGNSGSQDADGDGVCNAAEFWSGTDPRACGSRLCCQPLQLLPQNKFVLRWGSVPGRNYRVWQNTNLGVAPWTLLTPSALQGSANGINAYTGTVSAASSRGYWRVTTP